MYDDDGRFKLEFPEIRQDCLSMVWKISRELAYCRADGCLTVMPSFSAFFSALEALAGTAADDWGGKDSLLQVVNEIVNLQPIGFTQTPGDDSAWPIFVETVVRRANAEGLDVPIPVFDPEKTVRLTDKPEGMTVKGLYDEWVWFGKSRNWVWSAKRFFKKGEVLEILDSKYVR